MVISCKIILDNDVFILYKTKKGINNPNRKYAVQGCWMNELCVTHSAARSPLVRSTLERVQWQNICVMWDEKSRFASFHKKSLTRDPDEFMRRLCGTVWRLAPSHTTSRNSWAQFLNHPPPPGTRAIIALHFFVCARDVLSWFVCVDRLRFLRSPPTSH